MSELRFFIDHGMIHDRVTGKHVTTDGQPPFEDGIDQVCDLLNSLVIPALAQACAVRLEARPADNSKEWTEIFPAQLEWVAKAGHQVRAIELAAQPPAAPVEPVLSGLQEDLILMSFHNAPEPHNGCSADSALLQKLADMIERGQCGDVWDINDVSEADHARLPALFRRLA